MGRTNFSLGEADEIRRLLREKGVADRDRQKAIRGQLRRRYDFYISDFADEAGGFTASDFDALVSRGTVEIRSKRASSDSAEASAGTMDSVVLPDVLAPRLRVVFCGTAVGERSAQRGAYYAGPGNQFWPVLARVGLTPRQLVPEEFQELSDYGIGLTDLAKLASGADAMLASAAFDPDRFRRVIERLVPRAVAFNGKRAAEVFFGRSVEYGRQPETIGETALFVLPSTSGAARGYWDESYWRDLAKFVRA